MEKNLIEELIIAQNERAYAEKLKEELTELSLNPNPSCKLQNCKFSFGPSVTTCVYYPPIYDKHGNNINPDGNITRGSVKCLECNKEWVYSSEKNGYAYRIVVQQHLSC